ERERFGLRHLQQVEGEPLGRARSDPGQARQLGDEVLDRRGQHRGHCAWVARRHRLSGTASALVAVRAGCALTSLAVLRFQLAVTAALCGLLLFACVGSAGAATVPSGFTDAEVVHGLTNPTAMARAPDGRIFVLEQGGSVRVIENGQLLATPFLTLNVDSAGERGLLGIAFDPAFATNHFLYLHYPVPDPEPT